MPAQPQTVSKAILSSAKPAVSVPVHFNPASLSYTVENTVSQPAGAPKTAQFVAQFSGKLSMDLQFDTTGTGSDVRIVTNQVAGFMQASANASADAQTAAARASATSTAPAAPAKAPPVVTFAWGTYAFVGILESFKETIDFFSADGVALRALVSITLSRQDHVFDDAANFSKAQTGGSVVPSGSGDSATSVATRGGDPRAARQLASDNGLESMRFTGGAKLQIGGGASLGGPSGFAVGVSGGVSGGALPVTAGNAALFGGTASAGATAATSGAFAGLRTSVTLGGGTGRLDVTQIAPSIGGAGVSISGGAGIALGGGASAGASLGLSSDVGASFRFGDRLAFDSDD